MAKINHNKILIQFWFLLILAGLMLTTSCRTQRTESDKPVFAKVSMEIKRSPQYKASLNKAPIKSNVMVWVEAQTALIVAVPETVLTVGKYKDLTDNILGEGLVDLSTNRVVMSVPLDTPIKLIEFTYADKWTLNQIRKYEPIAYSGGISNVFIIPSSASQVEVSIGIQGITLITGKVVDAMSKMPLQNVLVTLSGSDNTTYTDANGDYFLLGVASGRQTVVFGKDGLHNNAISINVIEAQENIASQVAMVQNLAPGNVAVSLTWGDQPLDLDLHLISPNLDHIYSRNRTTLGFGIVMNTDSNSGLGPETIEIRPLTTGKYEIYVKNVSGSIATPLSLSGAEIRIFDSNGFVKKIPVPAGSTIFENYWHAFTIDDQAITPNNPLGITVDNTFSNTDPWFQLFADTTPPVINYIWGHTDFTVTESYINDYYITESNELAGTTVNTNNVTMLDMTNGAPGVPVPINVEYYKISNIIRVYAVTPLPYYTPVEITLGTGITDAAGNPLGASAAPNPMSTFTGMNPWLSTSCATFINSPPPPSATAQMECIIPNSTAFLYTGDLVRFGAGLNLPNPNDTTVTVSISTQTALNAGGQPEITARPMTYNSRAGIWEVTFTHAELSAISAGFWSPAQIVITDNLNSANSRTYTYDPNSLVSSANFIYFDWAAFNWVDSLLPIFSIRVM
ncbi:MAG: carboxypeptidase regulatory-like domain-containing protein [Deltaproteobacteria bacterium]|nr:carboxypeptidase regulatory-like domain-containing protein [Deltaproteobacteria bacterium]